MKRLLFILIALLPVLYFIGSNVYAAEDETYTGRIVAVDPRLHFFIVQGSEGERTFYAAPHSQFIINGQPLLLSELQKGDEVTVSVKTEQPRTTVKHVRSHTSHVDLQTFEGVITMVDPKEGFFIVKGKDSTMTFGVDRGSKLYIGGETKLLAELQKGEHVTVSYATEGQQAMVHHVSRHSNM